MLRRGMSLLAAAGAAAALAASVSAATPPAPTFSMVVTIQVTYATNCTFTVTVGNGMAIDATSPPGTTIPPGPYQLSIQTPLPDGSFDPSECGYPMFSLTGPGVTYSTTVGNGFDPGETTNLTLPPSSTYTMVDGNNPAAKVYFTTAATGTSTDLLPPPPAPSTPTGPTTGGTQTDIIGSAVLPNQGSLTATVPATGKPHLLFHGKPLGTLKAGRYTIVVRDSSRRRGLFLHKAHGKPKTIAGIAYTGKRTVKVDLTAGSWSFGAQASSTTRSFLVTS